LELFNSQIKEYSDDGNYFHAPYGYRIRNAGNSSFLNNEYKSGVDQLEIALSMAEVEKESRRIVIQIWNYELDLGVKSKDLPCNDLWFWKIRDNKLHTTIANRSNDINWGLTTNVFQFSFLSEICAHILGVELGTQTHNSDSLHLYFDGKMGLLTEKLHKNSHMDASTIIDKNGQRYYPDVIPFDYNYDLDPISTKNRLKQIDESINQLISSLIAFANFGTEDSFDICMHNLGRKSKFLKVVGMLLFYYIKHAKNNKDKHTARMLCENMLHNNGFGNTDIYYLSNYFLQIKSK
jgi:thymidylate synthase